MLGQFARFDLGKSFFHNKDVGLSFSKSFRSRSALDCGLFFVYAISLPLGIAKAVRAGTRFDTVTTFIVLLGYAVPSFVMGVALLVLFAGGSFVQWFPLRGLTSVIGRDLSLIGKIVDYLWHIALPVASMVLGGFAVITILTKNSVLEEIRKQYVLTARAKAWPSATSCGGMYSATP